MFDQGLSEFSSMSNLWFCWLNQLGEIYSICRSYSWDSVFERCLSLVLSTILVWINVSKSISSIWEDSAFSDSNTPNDYLFFIVAGRIPDDLWVWVFGTFFSRFIISELACFRVGSLDSTNYSYNYSLYPCYIALIMLWLLVARD